MTASKTIDKRSTRPPSMRYIRRIDEGHRAWKVEINRMNQTFHRYFADEALGGKANALVAAKAWRDEMVASTTDAGYAIWRRTLLHPNNTSGVSGLYRGSNPARTKEGDRSARSFYWQGYWASADGRRVSRSFSVNIHGEDGARALALKAREEGLADVAREIEAHRS